MEFKRNLIIEKGYVMKGRDYDFEKRYGFDETLDYEAERLAYNQMVDANNQEGCRAFMKNHGGSIAFAGKYAYYVELTKSGLLI